ncbi:hypothetical protein BRC94_01760 [Halobacteriales archaeon QS_5_70_17]|jgi:hypothetical protein|nr:MAG: hypothetical protein BRC94_01760 [Halobacteriales archaeon QS_5_70_17]
MLDKLGSTGAAGVLLLLGGLGLVAYANLLVAAGLALILVGLVLVARGLLGSVMRTFGMGGGL